MCPTPSPRVPLPSCLILGDVLAAYARGAGTQALTLCRPSVSWACGGGQRGSPWCGTLGTQGVVGTYRVPHFTHLALWVRKEKPRGASSAVVKGVKAQAPPFACLPVRWACIQSPHRFCLMDTSRGGVGTHCVRRFALHPFEHRATQRRQAGILGDVLAPCVRGVMVLSTTGLLGVWSGPT